MKRILVVALSAFLCGPIQADDLPAKVPGQRMLFTGHSFHIPLIPFIDQITQAAQISGHAVVARQMIGGSKVAQHWDLPDEKNIAKKTLREGGVDVMTMSPNWIVPDAAIDKFVALGLEKNPNLRFLVQVSWFPWDGVDAPYKVTNNNERDSKTAAELHAVYDPFRDIIGTQIQAINKQHGKTVAFLVPVGEAVLRLREQVIADKAPGITTQSELFNDPIGHGKATIHQLAAYCQFACIYRRSPVGLTCFEKPGNEPSHQLNHLLQNIAWDVVRDEPLSGVSIEDAPLKKP